MGPTTTRIESVEFESPLDDVGTDEAGSDLVYDPGETTVGKLFGPEVHTNCWNTAPPVCDGDYSGVMDAVGDDRTVPVPDGPGLGAAYDWDCIEDDATGSVPIYE